MPEALCRPPSLPESASPGGVADDAAKIRADEFWLFVSNHVVIHIAESGVRLVFVTIVKRLDDFFLEVFRPWMRLHDRFALSLAVFLVSQAQNIHFNPGRDQRDHRVHVLR